MPDDPPSRAELDYVKESLLEHVRSCHLSYDRIGDQLTTLRKEMTDGRQEAIRELHAFMLDSRKEIRKLLITVIGSLIAVLVYLFETNPPWGP